MKKLYAIINVLVLFGAIAVNYYINAVGINGNTIGSVSDKFDNLFTPADYTFSIWGVIYLALIVLVVLIVIRAFNNDNEDLAIHKLSPWLAIANLGNGVWSVSFITENVASSVSVMSVILLSLVMCIFCIRELSEKDPNLDRKFLPIVIGLYSGWISAAFIANISAWLVKNQWIFLMEEVFWAFSMIIVAGLVFLLVMYRERLWTFGLVGIWVMIGIAIKHWSQTPLLQWMAVLTSFIILFFGLSLFLQKKSEVAT